MSRHVHKFRLMTHIDGCHFYRSSFVCGCGATVHTYDERDPTEDPYSVVWMEDVGEKPCERCIELLGGASAEHHHEVIAAPKGAT